MNTEGIHLLDLNGNGVGRNRLREFPAAGRHVARGVGGGDDVVPELFQS